MTDRKPWDLTSTHALEGAAEWLLKRAEATVVLVVRGKDYAIASAPGMSGADVKTAAEFVLESAGELVEAREKRRREAAVRKRAAEIAGRSGR